MPTMWETWVQSQGWEDVLEKEMATHPVFLPGKSHGWRGLVGHSLRGRKDLDTTEQLHFVKTYIYITIIFVIIVMIEVLRTLSS